MKYAMQLSENYRAVSARRTLRQEPRHELPAAVLPRHATIAVHPPAPPCLAVSLPPCFTVSLPPPSQAKRNRRSNSNTVANRNRRNLLKTKARQISNSNKNGHVAFRNFAPRLTSPPFLFGTRMQAKSGASYRKQRIEPLSTRYTKRECFGLSRATSHKSRVTHFLRPPMLYCPLLRDARSCRNHWQPSQGHTASKMARGGTGIPGRRKG